jgi:ribosomal protein S6
MDTEKEIEDNGDPRIYEAGFLLLPTLSTEDAIGEFNSIKSVIEKVGATVISEGQPVELKLAYTMVKPVGTQNQKFSSARFGWIKFETGSGKLAGVNDSLTNNANLLRFIIVKTVKENSPISLGGSVSKIAEPEKVLDEVSQTEGDTTVEAIDKSIEELVAEK